MTAASAPDVVALHRRWTAVPSVSGEEEAVVAAAAEDLTSAGLDCEIIGRNLVARIGAAEPERALLLNSHLDTVPPAAGWTRDPWDTGDAGDTGDDDRTWGLGSSDAKASCAAMAAAAARLDAGALADAGAAVVLALVCDEETGGEGLEHVLPVLVERGLPFTAAVVGEPTDLNCASGQRGLVRLRLHARGRAAHAARPWQGDNAVRRACADVARLYADLDLGDDHDLLGPSTCEATVIEGGTRGNVLPGACTVTLDARPNPHLPNAELVRRVEALVESDVEAVSVRYEPFALPDDHPLVRAAVAAGAGGPVAFGGVSDLFFCRRAGVDGILLGPGDPARSHGADEFIEHDALRRAVTVYGRLVEAVLLGGDA